jgi:hypothetical protein
MATWRDDIGGTRARRDANRELIRSLHDKIVELLLQPMQDWNLERRARGARLSTQHSRVDACSNHIAMRRTHRLRLHVGALPRRERLSVLLRPRTLALERQPSGPPKHARADLAAEQDRSSRGVEHAHDREMRHGVRCRRWWRVQ